ncbi:MAG: stage III sporulation protein AB [Clostridia bacterium]|nr:stage III sporulation protein AB [Clostridia bacterium]
MKLIGGLLIICASICASFFYEKKQRNIINNQEALIDFLSYISSQIEYFAKPINEIFYTYKTKNDFIENSIKDKESLDLSLIDASIQQDVYNFFNELGKGYKKEEIALCSYTKNVISACTEKLKLEYSKKCRVYRSLSLFIGLSAVILLI